METVSPAQNELDNRVHNHAANLLINEKHTADDITADLIQQGLDEGTAIDIVSNLQAQFIKAKKGKANKDMLYGAMWCIGGTVLTLANIGFIFWGAIIFGAIQFFKGLVNSFE